MCSVLRRLDYILQSSKYDYVLFLKLFGQIWSFRKIIWLYCGHRHINWLWPQVQNPNLFFIKEYIQFNVSSNISYEFEMCFISTSQVFINSTQKSKVIIQVDYMTFTLLILKKMTRFTCSILLIKTRRMEIFCSSLAFQMWLVSDGIGST